jgi:hypothetical protein
MSTLETNLIQPSTGTTLTVGASGDTVTAPSGVTVAGAMANTPAFKATTSGSTTMPNQTATKIAFASEIFDTGSAYDTSNSRFTPQTAGKYSITAMIRFNSSTDFTDNILRIYKNGSDVVQNQQSHFHFECNTVTSIITLNGSSDYVEIYGFQNSGGDVDNEAGTTTSFFQGYKIIGA